MVRAARFAILDRDDCLLGSQDPGDIMTMSWGSPCVYFGSEISGTRDLLEPEISDPNCAFCGFKFRVVEIIGI